MKYPGLFLLFCMFAAQSHGQKMAAGYIVKENGDSLMGHISTRDMKNYSDTLLFEQANGGKKVFSTKDCKGFGSFKPAEKYERWTVTMDMSYFDKDMYLINAGSIKTDTHFLKNIYSGTHVSLYYYEDPVSFKEHFFIRSGDSMEELIQKYREPTLAEALRPGRSPNYVIVYIFRDQLYKYFDWEHNPKLKLKIDFAEYFYPKMVSIIKAIDDTKSN
jgi:hypothetical protein